MSLNTQVRRSQTSRVIKAPREAIYRAFTQPDLLVRWEAPGDMTARIHNFDLSVGGGYDMSLYYPSSSGSQGKTVDREDRYTARFIELTPPWRIIEAIEFDTEDPDFMGEMIMEVELEDVEEGTEVTITFRNIPPGISPEDNDTGTRMSLEKLAECVE